MAAKSATGIGAALPRSEDRRLLTGAGRYSDDISRPDQVYVAMVRSPHAHAELFGIDITAAAAMPGVLAVLTGNDWRKEGLGPMPAWGNPKDVELKNTDGTPIFYTPLWPVAVERIRRAGEIVAIVVAETDDAAHEAAEWVEIDCRILPAVVDPASAVAGGAPLLWDEAPAGNLNLLDEKGSRDATDLAFSNAVTIVSFVSWNQRVTGVPMEPRAALGEYDDGKFLLEAGGQGVIRFKNELAQTFGVEPACVHVISQDVGGGYGTRNHTYPEFALVLWAAKRVGKPVKWVCDRSEAFLSDYAGRDLHIKAELALDANGHFLALRNENIANIGTHTVSYVPLARGPTVYNGVYDIPTAHILSSGVFTNTTATASYRGAGRPEAMFLIERLVDIAAAETGIDRIELRRRNIIARDAIPYANAVGVSYDSGHFETSMDMAMELTDWSGAPARKDAARAQGKLRGIGLANYIETATGYPQERAEMEILPGGMVDLVIGTQSSGQSHETTFPQIVSDWLGVPYESVRLRTGDTDFVASGSGSHSSRSMKLAGHLYRQTTDEIIERGTRIAAHLLEASPADVVFRDGQFEIEGTDRRVHLFDVAKEATGETIPEDLRGRLRAEAEIAVPLPTYPNGCHATELEIDPETGVVEIIAHIGIDDTGTVINSLVVDGQTHGGAVQGLGQALMEFCAYDADSGQLLAGSFMDYAMPRADDVPSFTLAFNTVPAPSTRLGVKGGGEGGTTAAPPAIINAIVDALSEFGVRHIEMPATPERIWRAINQSKHWNRKKEDHHG
jgi:carbon-monoxide dehydrogenase large subunit